MEKFLEQMADIFEENTVTLEDKLVDFDAWDSLAQLSIIALADEEYGVTLSVNELIEAETIQGLKELIAEKKA
jgi:acyl carrier protein